MFDLSGKHGVIVGVANKRSIAWAIAEAADRAGAQLAVTYVNEAALRSSCLVMLPRIRKLTS